MKEIVIIRDAARRAWVANHITGLNVEKAWTITIEPHKNKRSLSQNALYWKWLENVVDHVHEATGQDKEDIHEFFKRHFLAPKVKEVFGYIVQTWSTKNLNTAEMSEYLDKIYAWVTTELGLLLPVPEDLGRITAGRTTEARG